MPKIRKSKIKVPKVKAREPKVKVKVGQPKDFPV
jgi:hypothetical protein